MRKRWLFIPLIMGLLALVVTSGAILAQGNKHPGGGGAAHGLASRVAEILGLEEERVQSAFYQAIREHQNEHMQSILARLVEAERLTQDEATSVEGWFLARPDAAIHLKRVLLWGEDDVERRLGRMVNAGLITREQADAVMEWYQERPEALPTRSYHRGMPGHRSHRGPARGDGGANGTGAFRGAPERSLSPVTAPIVSY